MRPFAHAHRGLTLMEVVASTFLVSTLLIVSLNATVNLRRGHASELESAVASRWLAVFCDEVSSTAFSDPTTLTGFGIDDGEDAADRTTLDDCDDYHGQSWISPTRRDGTTISDLTGWTLGITVTSLDPTATGTKVAATDGSHLRQILVSLTSDTGQVFTASVLVSNTPAGVLAGETNVGWNEVELTSAGGRTLRAQAPARNFPTIP